MSALLLALAVLAGAAVTYVYACQALHGHRCAICGDLAGHISLTCGHGDEVICPDCEAGDCALCGGHGVVPCQWCDGSGRPWWSTPEDDTTGPVVEVCPECDGSGDEPCRDCTEAVAVR